jgi:hypothetical protein
MVVAAILDFVKMLYLTNSSKNTLLMLLYRQIWWQSVERFKSYSTLSIFKMADENVIVDQFVVKYHSCYLPVQYGDNRLNGSKVIVLLSFTRWKIRIWVGIFTHLLGKMGWSDHYQTLHACSCMLRNDFSDFWCWYFKGRRFCKGLKFRASHLLGVLALQLEH